MAVSTVSITVALPPRAAVRRFREYGYRRIIGRARSDERLVNWRPTDSMARNGEAMFTSSGDGTTTVAVSFEVEGDELAVMRDYRRYLEGYKLFAESAPRVEPETIPLERAA